MGKTVTSAFISEQNEERAGEGMNERIKAKDADSRNAINLCISAQLALQRY